MGDEIASTKQDKPLMQELILDEQQKLDKEQKAQIKNKTWQSSGTDSDMGSWKSIILETLEGVHREYIIKPLIETKNGQDKTN